ncbi:MAG: hypothetical protein HW412_161 [Bacteroidetes bacterium]|nr:hypothetical protein [Bacteroidota bacterium]
MRRFLIGILLLATSIGSAQDIYNRARASLSSRDTAAAVTAFQEAVKAGQKLAESNFYLGAIALAQHRIDEAIRYLQASLKEDDDNVEATKLLGDAYAEKKDRINALAQYKLAAKLAPKDCGVSVAYGQALVEADSMDQGIVQLTRAKECMPDNPAIYISLGDAYFKIGVKPLAITNYQKASELAPKDRDLQLKIARALAANRQYTDAVKAYIVAEQIDSTYPDTYLEHGKILVLAKLYKLAVPPLNRFVKLSPRHVEGSQLYAKALFGSELFAEAATASKTSLQMDSTNNDVWRIRAYSLVDARDPKDRDCKAALEAFAVLQRRNAIKPEDLAERGRAYSDCKMDNEALADLEQALKADTANCDILIPLGSLQMKKKDYKRAAELFEKKILCDPKILSAYVNAGLCYQQPENLNLPRARELFIKVVELRPDYLNGRLFLARYYVQADSFEAAEAQYLEVLRLIGDQIDKNEQATFGEANYLLGQLYMGKKRYEKAIDAYRKASSVGYDNGVMQLSWGQCILQTLNKDDPEEESRKKNDDAMKRFRRCVELDPNNAEGHFWLGETLVRARVPGEDDLNKKLKEEACAEWRKVLKLDPKNENAKKGLERIGC